MAEYNCHTCSLFWGGIWLSITYRSGLEFGVEQLYRYSQLRWISRE